MPVIDLDSAAAVRVREIMARPIEPVREFQSIYDFDPWDIFPALYGSYDSAFDQCALDVLCEIRDAHRVREDLAADMFREMLCTAHLCNYGTSPRFCFPTPEFRPLLPDLIEKWKAWSRIQWED